MLKFLTETEKETFERIRDLFQPRGIRFTLVGGAACREYGLTRPVKDLDFVVNPYLDAEKTIHASGVFMEFGERDVTHRSSTFEDFQTKVHVDFISGGIRITDRVDLGGVVYSDPLPIPDPVGFGDLLPLHTLIESKLGAILSGLDTRALGANYDGRNEEEVQKDINDIRDLISAHNLSRDLEFRLSDIERIYGDIFDGKPPASKLNAAKEPQEMGDR